MKYIIIFLLTVFVISAHSSGPTDGDVEKNVCEINGGTWDKTNRKCSKSSVKEALNKDDYSYENYHTTFIDSVNLFVKNFFIFI